MSLGPLRKIFAWHLLVTLGLAFSHDAIPFGRLENYAAGFAGANGKKKGKKRKDKL